MTKYYLDFGDMYGPRGEGTTPIGNAEVDPTDLATVQALWSALPPDLRLALAKTAPKVAEKWIDFDEGLEWVRKTGPMCVCNVLSVGPSEFAAYCDDDDGDAFATFPTLAEAQSACDAALRAQGHVLDGDTP